MTAITSSPTSDDLRTGTTAESIERGILDNLFYALGRFPAVATNNDWYLAIALAARDRVMARWAATGDSYRKARRRTVCYLSAEYLPGPQTSNALLNLGLEKPFRDAVHRLGLQYDAVLEQEEEPGLGNGGLGRLAACYMDSLATLEAPAIGYGIHYEFGIFDQEIRDGWQVEKTDKWLKLGNPWELLHPEICFEVKLGGRCEPGRDAAGRYQSRWVPERVVKGIACDTPVIGYRVVNTNLLRLWKAEAIESFDFAAFNTGDYYGAVNEKIVSETISKVLYPNDQHYSGKVLRLAQQYFFVSCSLQDMLRLLFQGGDPVEHFPQKYAVQLNDTHPALAIAELMRLLVDEHGMNWDPAWDIVSRTFAYTNHTLMPEALERWPVDLLGRLLPRPLEIIYEINRRFLDDVRARYPGDADRIRRLSLIDEQGERTVRMANLACVGSHHINGVARLHTELLSSRTLRDFGELWPEKFNNKTNGVTPRRFLALANPGLSELISSRIGDRWTRHLEDLRGLEAFAADPDFQQRWNDVKLVNKRRLAHEASRRMNIDIPAESLFDVQIKRLHEYKRQHLNVLHVVHLYRELKRDPALNIPARTVLFAGKAAPGYWMAKLVIRLIHAVAEVVDHDPDIRGRLRVAFIPDYNVRHAQWIIPAADLSEQISTAGTEASGTGNMKLALNGALTIGTLDGANIEIREEVGAENFFLFGLTAEEVMETRRRGYRPRDVYDRDERLRSILDMISGGYFSHGDRELFRPLVDSLLNHDEFLVLADFAAYLECQQRVSRAYQDRAAWTRMSILNVARMGKFSSDRAVQEYCDDIWRIQPHPVALP